MSDTADTDSRLHAALWEVVAEHGWRGVTPRRLAALSGWSTAEIRARFASPAALLDWHMELVDRAVLAGTIAGQGGSPRDRVFDVLMRRLDALQPHRAGMLEFLRGLRRDPALFLSLAPAHQRMARRMLEAAELDTAGPCGAARAQGLLGIWILTLRAWEKDDSTDLGTTMAALDRILDRSETLARTLRLDPGDRAAPAGT
jgi:AcrR family transcriptional regulator